MTGLTMGKPEKSVWVKWQKISLLSLYTQEEKKISVLYPREKQAPWKGRNIMSTSRERQKQIKKIKDQDIDYSDIPELNEEWFKKARIVMPKKKKAISLRLDQDIFEWFKSQGKGYQTKINAILRAYMNAHHT